MWPYVNVCTSVSLPLCDRGRVCEEERERKSEYVCECQYVWGGCAVLLPGSRRAPKSSPDEDRLIRMVIGKDEDGWGEGWHAEIGY